MMSGFHRNKPVEAGLVAATRAILSTPHVPYDLVERPSDRVSQGLGVTKFLKYHTSTTEWEDFQSMLARAQELDFNIFAPSLHTMICHAVTEGWFEKKREPGCKQMYRRIEGEWHIEKKKPGVRTGLPKRKFTAKSW